MHLKSVKLTHFRGYRATTVAPTDEAMTGIVELRTVFDCIETVCSACAPSRGYVSACIG